MFRRSRVALSKCRVFRSPSKDIFENLAIEDWLHRTLPLEQGDQALMLWVNQPCVVSGRSQNLWLESDVELTHGEGVPVVRRRSGGGTVVHDEGNACVTFFSRNMAGEFDKARNHHLVIKALAEYGIAASIRDTDLVAEGKKFSGSAFRMSHGKAYHHLTSLVSSDLDTLRRYLKVPKMYSERIETKAVRSTPSPVENLNALAKIGEPTVEDFHAKVTHHFAQAHGSGPLEVEGIRTEEYSGAPEYLAALKEFKSVEWLLSGTPAFQHTLSGVFPWGRIEIVLHVRKGRFEKAEVKSLELPGISDTAPVTKTLELFLSALSGGAEVGGAEEPKEQWKRDLLVKGSYYDRSLLEQAIASAKLGAAVELSDPLASDLLQNVGDWMALNIPSTLEGSWYA